MKWINDVHRRYNTNSQIELRTSMLKSRLFDYSHAYILVGGTITMGHIGAGAVTNNRKKY